ncbi:MAG: hypothetical protein CMN32_11265 [Saprospirales bacterium]|nr:hypothetical protein [Saprospirales bacterium]
MTRPVDDTVSLPGNIIDLPSNGYKFRLYSSIFDVPESWDEVAPPNEFLRRKYLGVLEQNPPRGMRFTYVIFYDKDQPIGISYFQISHFRPDRSIKDVDTKDKYPCIIRAFARHLKVFVAKKFDHNLLVCGNLLLTGEHGFHFAEGKLNREEQFRLLEECIRKVHAIWEEQGLYIDGIFIKDIEPQHLPQTRVLVDKKYRKFTFHPNMVLNIRDDWESFDDYLAALSSKYRVRARRAFKAAKDVVRKDLDLGYIRNNNQRLYQLYLSVMDNASFNMVVLDEQYLPALKEAFGDQFKITGYFLDGELIGYCSTLLNDGELEAHFLGFEEACNRKCQLYLNILYDILRQGIEAGAKKVVYARTAMEIKSSVGAVPVDMLCYIKAAHPVTNKVLPHLLEYLRPPDDWVQRKPFKR